MSTTLLERFRKNVEAKKGRNQRRHRRRKGINKRREKRIF